MVVHPRLVGVLLRGRSAWKALAETDYFVLQHHPRHLSNAFRIITRGFPHYRVAEGDSVELLKEELEFLSRMARVSIQGKITSKKISTWLKSTFERNSILAIAPPEDRLTQPEDHRDHLNQLQEHDADGYLSDSSDVSHEELTDVYSTNIKTRRSLRRAISLEDLTTASAVHHPLHTSSFIHSNRSRPTQVAHLPPHHLDSTNQHLLLNPTERPASSASIYHRRQRSLTAASEQGISFVPLKDRPYPTMAIGKDESFDHGNHDSLPTPDVSPEELSESSEELVIIQGELLEEAKLARTVDRIRPPQIHYGSYPGTGSGSRVGPETATIAGDMSPSADSMVGPLSWLTESPFIDALVNWIEGPDHPAQQKSQDKDKPNPWLDIPLQFIALLTYPEPDAKNGNKMTLALVRETAFVRQRRKTLLMLTAYTLIVRYCSFDFFVVVLFASNCAMLFLMKNSGRMNVNMAKRAVRQRVGWAKQWAGSIFRRGAGSSSSNNNSNNSNSGNGNSGTVGNNHQHSNSGSSHQLNSSINSPSATEFAPHLQSSPVTGESTSPVATEGSPQMKRRGLFGKRKTVDQTTLHNGSSSSVQAIPTTTTASSVHGVPAQASDGVSILSTTPTGTTATTQKRRFFRRNNNSSNSNGSNNSSSSTNYNSSHHHIGNGSPTPPVQASAPVPIPSKPSASSTPSSHSGARHQATLSSTPKLSAMSTPLSSSPLAQSQSLPQLQFSPLKPFSPPMVPSDDLINDDREWTESTTKWSAKPQSSLSILPPLLLPGASIGGGQAMQQSQSHGSLVSRDVYPPVCASPLPLSASSPTLSSLASGGSASAADFIGEATDKTTAAAATAQKPLIVSGLSQLLGRTSPVGANSSTQELLHAPVLPDVTAQGDGSGSNADLKRDIQHQQQQQQQQQLEQAPDLTPIFTNSSVDRTTDDDGQEGQIPNRDSRTTLDAVTSAAADAMGGL